MYQHQLHVARGIRDSGPLQARLGIENKQVTADGKFSLEEVECIGDCCSAPAMQVNYDFHDELTPAKVDEILG
jgi:NADH-quinone oxidoreductase subunit E